MAVKGIHHITAIASDAQQNIDFYTKVLGLRLVKVTVNFDDPSAYHLYYGDSVGSPGSILTFFVWPEGRPGRVGSTQVLRTVFSVPVGSTKFWLERLGKFGHGTERSGRGGVLFSDSDGLPLELLECAAAGLFKPWGVGEIDEALAIRGFAGAVVSERERGFLKRLFSDSRQDGSFDDARTEFRFSEDENQGRLSIESDPGGAGVSGVGTVHHIALRASDDRTQEEVRAIVAADRLPASEQRERCYFRSIYFRSPGGVLFEVATDDPGFLIDEDENSLGSALRLPPWLESRRAEIAASLPAITYGSPRE